MAPLGGLSELRTRLFRQAGEVDEAVQLVAPSACTALEVEVVSGTEVPVVIELLDDNCELVVRGTVLGDGISLGVEASSGRVSEKVTLGRSGQGQGVRFFYDSGICEVYTASGSVRSEIFYGRHPVKRVAVRWGDGGYGLTATGTRGSVRAWELANIW